MVNFRCRHYLNRALLSAVLTSFSITYAVPVQAQQFNFGFNEVAFLYRLEKQIEKLMKSEGKGIDKIIEYFVGIKKEIETSYNTKFNIDSYMDQLVRDLNKQGVKTNKKQIDAIKKKIKGEEKKANKHAKYLANTMYLEGYEMNALDEQMMFGDDMMLVAKHSKGKDKDDKDDKEEIVIPSLLVYGVTISLCGLFLMCLPIPACKDWGSKMVVAGVTACANSLCSENDKKKNEEKNR
jgi:hypothetical protein